MQVHKTVTLALDQNEIDMLGRLIGIALDTIDEMRKDEDFCGYSFADLQRLAELGRRLKDL